MDKCPKCGGTTGAYYTVSVEYQQWVKWDGEPVSAQETGNGHQSAIATCHDCGARMNIKRIVQEEPK